MYQIYVRSFCDANGDGIGDLRGVIDRLEYLGWLGIDGIWLTPFYPSPQHDHGYDVANYLDVDPMFGTLSDFDEMLQRAHDLGIRVLVDIIPNHTSTAHKWFCDELTTPRDIGSSRYVFRDPAPDGGPPNDWQAVFGGSAWEFDPGSGRYYLHTFDTNQADLNWENPAVPAAFLDILRFWLDRGVDGFRIDVAELPFKDVPRESSETPGANPFAAADRPAVHALYRDWRRLLDSYPGQRMLVGEIWVDDVERWAAFQRPDELNLAFNFQVMTANWNAAQMRMRIDRSIAALSRFGAPSCWVLANHDRERQATRFGGGERGRARARAALMLLLAFPGPMFLYQGEELGLEDVDLPDEARQDPVFFRTGGGLKGRDGSRIPLPWTRATPNLGFAPGNVLPWLPIPSDWAGLSVEAQQGDETSVLNFYRGILALRKELGLARRGEFRWRDAPADCLVMNRRLADGREVSCTVNFGDETRAFDRAGDLVAASGDAQFDSSGTTLAADSAVWTVEG